MNEATDEAVTLLTETFSDYLDAEAQVDRIFLNYKFLRATEAQVHRAQRDLAAARSAHLEAIRRVARRAS